MARKKSHKKLPSSAENPFDLKVNRNKFSVLGQKVKGARGRPGVSHSLGNAKRKEVFHKKRVESQKANKYLDKRLLNSSETYEDPATARLIQERKKKFKKSIFNLNEDESLTHKGMPLLTENDLKDDIGDSDDEDPLDSQFVKQAHFGGFMENSAPKSRKEIIDELIVESKKKKNERKLAREKNIDLIEKLDQEWKERHASLPLLKSGKHNKELPEKNDPFDVILQELKFEKRTTPSSPLKSVEEIAKEESEKLKNLEEQRNRRMMNPMDNNGSNNHFSADSIYDGLDIQFESIEDQDVGNTNGTANEPSGDDSSEESSDSSENEAEGNDNMEKIEDESVLMLSDSSGIPDTLEELCRIINSQNEELHIIVENIINKVIKNKTKQNLLKLEGFFSILIQYVMREGESPNKALYIIDSVLPHFYTVAEISPVNIAKNLLAFLDEEQEIFQSSKGKKMKRDFPRFHCLVLFKISSGIYSVSDFKHPVVTPVITFMCDVLSSAYAVSFHNIFTRLFVCKIIYNCVSYSKRYVSEVIWFLNKTLELAINNSKKFNLVIRKVISVQEKTELNFEISEQMCDDIVKTSILSELIELIHKYSLLYSLLPSYHEIFSTSLNICKRLPVGNYPSFLKEEITKFITAVEGVKIPYTPLTYENKKPVPLKMFEPSFDSKFSRNKDDIRKKRKLIKSVGQKIKKEERDALREMRRDNQVIAAEKLKEILAADDERKRKVKQLYQELAMQEGEYKKFVKKK